MPFIPHTAADVASMLNTLGLSTLDQLFDEIPAQLKIPFQDFSTYVPPGMTEFEITRLMSERALQDTPLLNFVGAGAYEHHIPAAVWDIAGRGEFMTSYTPYQAEASQGNLQLIYEYQSMMTELTQMEISNASLYDGASALAEAVLMAVRIQQSRAAHEKPFVWVAGTLHPTYQETLKTLLSPHEIEWAVWPFEASDGESAAKMGVVCLEKADQRLGARRVSAVVIQQPNFLGQLEAVSAITDWVHDRDGLLIAVVNPLSLGLLEAPGAWGKTGADIVCGEGQPLGIPLASGGPYFGFLCTRQALVRQMPGRIVGQTVDQAGRIGYTLTLQAREQHIRRAKANSNICTNQGLLVTAATLYMSLLGVTGLYRVGVSSHHRTQQLVAQLCEIPGVRLKFTGPYFHEVVLAFNRPITEVLRGLRERGIAGGYALGTVYPQLSDCLLMCATETKIQADLDRYTVALRQVMEANH
jgi:glycine dehydrogenase subunit 1